MYMYDSRMSTPLKFVSFDDTFHLQAEATSLSGLIREASCIAHTC